MKKEGLYTLLGTLSKFQSKALFHRVKLLFKTYQL